LPVSESVPQTKAAVAGDIIVRLDKEVIGHKLNTGHQRAHSKDHSKKREAPRLCNTGARETATAAATHSSTGNVGRSEKEHHNFLWNTQLYRNKSGLKFDSWRNRAKPAF
jgi:hypothetical protein